jgi:hypothetical protein
MTFVDSKQRVGKLAIKAFETAILLHSLTYISIVYFKSKLKHIIFFLSIPSQLKMKHFYSIFSVVIVSIVVSAHCAGNWSNNNLKVPTSNLLILCTFCLFAIIGTWKKADLTNYESYPTSEEECHEYNGCEYEGEFAFVDGKKSKDWVKKHNIISINKKDSKKYKLKTFAIRQGTKSINATVYDECSDSDCDGCCSDNSKNTGFLIDMESFTYKRFGGHDGIVEWMCLDC